MEHIERWYKKMNNAKPDNPFMLTHNFASLEQPRNLYLSGPLVKKRTAMAR
jgi:hypothetical protein